MKKLVRKNIKHFNNYPLYFALLFIGALMGVLITPKYTGFFRNVNNDTKAEGDIISPKVTITYPTAKTRISPNMNLNITANATDNIGVTYVDFYVSKITKATSAAGGFFQIPGRKVYIERIHQCIDESQPYNCNWTVPPTRNTTYLIQAVGYDLAGNQGISKYIEFIVR